jgi:prevent-host-death family protein
MREMTATEAARNFARVLDDAAAGEVTVITRQGERVAQITPAPRANGAAINQLAARWAGHIGLDEEFSSTVAEVRENARNDAHLDADPWQS